MEKEKVLFSIQIQIGTRKYYENGMYNLYEIKNILKIFCRTIDRFHKSGSKKLSENKQ